MRISDWSSDVCSSDLNNGRQCSAPRNIGTMPFDHLSPVLADALIARGYEALTPVQAQVVEAEAKGRDLLVSAQTGSGKTVAFGLAMADELLEDGRLPFATAPLALIVAPTRELALQVSRELGWLSAKE